MKTLCNYVFLMIIMLSFQEVVIAQNIGMLLNNQESNGLEKIYLHTDRDFYFFGDTIWFRAYLLDGQSMTPDTDLQNLYVELIDNQGKIIREQVILCENGLASGNMMIPDTITSGPCLFRAYTDYLRNFGEDAFFYKQLRISKMKSSFDIEEERSMVDEEEGINVSFFPEGGFLLEGIQNLVSFTAIDKRGRGVAVKGKVLDSNGSAVSIFRTDYKGMGKLFFIPQKGELYTVEIDDHPTFSYHFDDIKKEEVKLVMLEQDREELTLEVLSNAKRHSRKRYYVACFSRDRLLFYKEIVLRGTTKVKIETDVMLGVSFT